MPCCDIEVMSQLQPAGPSLLLGGSWHCKARLRRACRPDPFGTTAVYGAGVRPHPLWSCVLPPLFTHPRLDTEVFARGARARLDVSKNQTSWGVWLTIQLNRLVIGKTCCEQSKCCECFCFYRLQPGAHDHDVTLDGCQTGEQSWDARPVETHLILNHPASLCKHLSFIDKFLLHPPH